MGIVRTNAYILGSGASGAADLPTRLNSLTANGGDGFVNLSLGYGNTSYITGVQINYKTGSYPTSPTDGSSVKVSGAAASVKVAGLLNGTTYYFRVFLYRVVNDVTYYQTDITNARVTGLPIGVTISGITPLVAASDHIVINKSGTFTLTAPKGTRIVICGGGENATPLRPAATSYSMKKHNFGGKSGYVFETTLTSDVVGASCTLSLGTRYNNGSGSTISTLKIGNTTYTSSSGTAAPISTKWGPLGGKGGDAPSYSTENSYLFSASYSENGNMGYAQLTGADGAGGGGGELSRCSNLDDKYVQYLTKFMSGGNNGRYGNKGGNGGDLTTSTYGAGENGSSGSGGDRPRSLHADDGDVNHHYPYPENDSRDTAYRLAGSGGGGGYGAGGGAGAWYLGYSENDGDHWWYRGNPGEGGDGALIIELP